MMLDLRVLNYFLTVAREESITHAAEALHLSQPTLSRQLRDMEEMLGKELMIRGPRRITLTEEGLFLKKRAEEILSLASHTEQELRSDDTELNGNIRIGSAESDSVRSPSSTVMSIRKNMRSCPAHTPITGAFFCSAATRWQPGRQSGHKIYGRKISSCPSRYCKPTAMAINCRHG